MLPGDGSPGSEVPAEVVGFRDPGACLFMPYGDLRGIAPGTLIRNTSTPPLFPVGRRYLGRVIDAFGNPIDNGEPIAPRRFNPIFAPAPPPMERPRICDPWTWACGPLTAA